MCLIQLHYRFTVMRLLTKELLYIIVLGSLIGPFDPYADQESTKESSTTAIRGFGSKIPVAYMVQWGVFVKRESG